MSKRLLKPGDRVIIKNKLIKWHSDEKMAYAGYTIPGRGLEEKSCNGYVCHRLLGARFPYFAVVDKRLGVDVVSIFISFGNGLEDTFNVEESDLKKVKNG